MDRQDETLQGNEKIEVAIQALQKEATQEQLAHTLTVIRRRMKDSGQVIVAVEPSIGTTQMNLKTLQTSDGANWWYAFTSFNEEMKGADSVKSTFLVDIDKLFDAALTVPEIKGVILNPFYNSVKKIRMTEQRVKCMKLRNVLIVVKDIEKSKKFYHDLFGLDTILDNDGNVILTEGLVLQDEQIWKSFLEKEVIPENNACELYFEESDIEAFVEKLEKLYPDIKYVNQLMTYSWGQKVVRFYDLDGNLIEVRTLV